MTTSKTTEVGLAKLPESHTLLPCAHDAGHRAAGLNICSIGFQSFFGLILFYSPFPAFWTGNIYPMPLYHVTQLLIFIGVHR